MPGVERQTSVDVVVVVTILITLERWNVLVDRAWKRGKREQKIRKVLNDP